MGMDLRVRFEGETPTWEAVAALLTSRGWPVQMRMIDNELAFPDEIPAPIWRELRVGADGAMITIRRTAQEVVLVAWGNADPAQMRLWHRLAWAFAEAGGGKIHTDTEATTAAEFATQTGLGA